MKSIDLSIIIVSYNAERFLKPCLESIFSTITNCTYEVIVIDNNSQDNSVAVTERHFPSVAIIKNKHNTGYAMANNQGIQTAAGKFLLLLNPDTILYDNTIDTMLRFAQTSQKTGIVGCKVINRDNRLQWDSCGSFLNPTNLCFKEFGLEKLGQYFHPLDNRLMRYWKRDSSRLVDWISGVCMLINRSLIEQIGLLDEQYFSYMEDMDYCRLAVKEGWQVYFLHNVSIFHNIGGSWKQQSSRHLHTALVSEKRYLKKFYGYLGVIIFKTLHLLGSSAKFLLHNIRGTTHQARDHFHILQWIINNRL